MKAVAFCGSARKNGNTALLLKTVLEPLTAMGVDTEMVELAGTDISGCKACMGCFKEKNQRCVFDNDVVNECIEKMVAADVILLGSPNLLCRYFIRNEGFGRSFGYGWQG